MTDIAVGYNRDYGCAPSTATILNFAYFEPMAPITIPQSSGKATAHHVFIIYSLQCHEM